jgi:hypothetical protein
VVGNVAVGGAGAGVRVDADEEGRRVGLIGVDEEALEAPVGVQLGDGVQVVAVDPGVGDRAVL